MKQTIDDIFVALPSYFNEPNPAADSTFYGGLNPASLGSGELQGNTTVQAGHLKSGNYLEDVRGWFIDADGNAFFNDGTFRGTFNIGGTQITVHDIADVQAAIDMVEAAGGGTVYLQIGTYLLTAHITVPSGVTLEGVSRDGVILDCNGSYSVQIAGTNEYTTGTVTINDGDTTVVGLGTTWTAAMVGRFVFLSDYWYEITACADNTHLTIGSAYVGDNLSGSTYTLADVNFNGTLRKLTIENATGSGVIVRAAMEPNVDDLYIIDCGLGLDLDYVVYPRVNVTSNENDVNMEFDHVFGFKIDFADTSYSLTGAGFAFNDCGSATFFDSSSNHNAMNGGSLIDCHDISFISVEAGVNGAHGIELVSGCAGIKFLVVDTPNNTGDGIKMTATSDENVISSGRSHDNGGYGVNIAAATCDNNVIGLVPMSNNSSGNLNDLGTGTVIAPNPGV